LVWNGLKAENSPASYFNASRKRYIIKLLMAKHLLRIRAVDRKFFDAIRFDEKTIETRAATDKFRLIKPGDILKFICGKDVLEKKVLKAYHFKNIDGLIKSLEIKKIIPFASSLEEAKKIWFGFPDYKEKIKKYGLVAFELENK